MPRRGAMLILLALLAGCAGPGEDNPSTASLEPASPAPPETCPADLSYVKSKLVTPYPQLEAFIGKDALDETFSEPVDQMIRDSGGIDPAIAGGERYVQQYEEVLKNEAEMRVQFKKNGMDQEWIDTYFLSNKDGLTINQAFVDAVKCRQEQKQPPMVTQNQAPAG